jgi:C1A family cysteine protease
MPASQQLVATPISDAERAFMDFVSKFRRSYGTKEEFAHRLGLFEKTYKQIIQHNQSNKDFKLGVNHMSDFSEHEYKQLLGWKASGAVRQEKHLTATAAASVDWRTAGAVTPVKNQGQCGSCWSFSTTGSLEGANFIFGTKTLISLSEQNLVDCSTLNHGCNGGSMDLAFRYSETNHLETEAAYPYTARDGTCKYATAKGQVGAKAYTDVPKNSPGQLATAVSRQPVSIAIEADKAAFQSYTSGIITSATCGTALDHGVLIVGYGTEGTQDYWIVKNSWGPTWGEKGYVRIAKDKATATGAGICGINMQPSYPTI